MIEAGHFYTMSAEKSRCGDRSWSHDLWEVLGTNETHAIIKNAMPRGSYSFGVEPMVVVIANFDWTNADDLVKIAADHATD